MTLSLGSTIRIAPDVEMPRLGLGTYKSADGPEAKQAALSALGSGYRLIDTASLYGNETSIGTAIAESHVPREDLFLATKVWNDEQGHDGTLVALERSLQRLGTDYVDLYLIHWPVQRHLAGTWRAMEEALEEGRVRAIGVCNFLPNHLEELFAIANVPPAIDQVEFHPWLQQPDLQRACAEKDVVLQAWAPLMRGRAAQVPELAGIAESHNKTASQVCVRWVLQKGYSVIPKSVHAERILENADVFDFELTVEQMDAIARLDSGTRLGGHHPDDVWRGVSSL